MTVQASAGMASHSAPLDTELKSIAVSVLDFQGVKCADRTRLTIRVY